MTHTPVSLSAEIFSLGAPENFTTQKFFRRKFCNFASLFVPVLLFGRKVQLEFVFSTATNSPMCVEELCETFSTATNGKWSDKKFIRVYNYNFTRHAFGKFVAAEKVHKVFTRYVLVSLVADKFEVLDSTYRVRKKFCAEEVLQLYSFFTLTKVCVHFILAYGKFVAWRKFCGSEEKAFSSE